MGVIAEMTRGKVQQKKDRLWREAFGATSKEEGSRQNPTPGGTFARSATSIESFKRLLQAMRSMAPGGWSDDRYEQSRHFVGIQYLASHRKGEQLAQSEFQVFRKDPSHPKGKRPVKEGESEYELVRLLENPNEEDSFGDMLYRWNQQMDLTGTALTWMVPNQMGQPYELYSVPTAIAVPQPAINPDFPDGFYRIQPLYPYGPFSSYPTPSTAVGAPIPAQWMLRFKYPHPLLRYEGYSPLTALRLHIDEVESMDRSRWYNMKRTVNPSAVLNFDDIEGMQPLNEPEIERLHAEFEAMFMGDTNVGKLFVGSPGSKLEPFGTSPREMDYHDSWEQLVSFVLAGFGITKPAAGMIEDSSYASLFATLKQLHLLTLQPMCNRIANSLTRKLAPFFGKGLVIEIRCPRIDDHEVKERKLRLALDGKVIKKGELRDELDLPVVGEEWEDEMAGEQEQPEMPGMLGPDGQPMQPGKEGKVPAELQGPDTGTLGENSKGPQGPRFSDNGVEKKSIQDRELRELRNGRMDKLCLNGKA